MSSFKQRVIEKLETQKKGRTLDKTLMDLPSLDLLKNLKEAALLAATKLRENVKTLIVGDYDADGIMATTVLYGFLKDAGFSDSLIGYIIPSRLRDGYGLSQNIINYAIENGYKMIITVDNGIAATVAIANAKKAGLIVIVTDHHTAPAVLPNADYIVCPKQPGETFPFIDISGATVAWYFVAALRDAFDVKIDIRKYLDLVAITVVSDVMPLNDINLAILRYGLEKIKKQERSIYRLLWTDWTIPCLNETDLSFGFIPMINAIGRINDANLGVELFLSTDQKFIEDTFYFVQEVNEKRKALTREYLDNAEQILEVDYDPTQKVVIIRNKGYHEGIVGIIAGKLAETYQLPAYAFSWSEEKGIWKGSGRSFGEVHLYQLTNQAQKYILGFGGHKGAVGVAVEDKNWDKFKKTLEKAALKLPKEDFIDLSLNPIECTLDDIDINLMETLESYGPFGEGNPQLKFKTSAIINPEKELKNGLHFKCELRSITGKAFTGLFFNVKKEKFLEQINDFKQKEIIFYPSKNYNLRTQKFGFDFICEIA